MPPRRKTSTKDRKKMKIPLQCKTMKIQPKINDAFQVRKSRKSSATKKAKASSIPAKIKTDQQNEISSNERDQTAIETLLHQFDLNWEYGPAIGVTRLERWERAKNLGLNPPIQVKDAIEKSVSQDINTCVWDQKYKNVL